MKTETWLNKNNINNADKTGSILSCTALTKVYRDGERHIPVLEDINFSVSPGEQVAIVGRSGSGKTTLINLLGGLEAPTQGDVFVRDVTLNRLSESKRGLLRNRVFGFIFQFHHLLSEFTALENVCMPLLIRGTTVSDAREMSMNCLEKVSLEHRYQHKPSQLSGGERQRVAIARALVTKPLCILADEPTGNLDNKSADQVYELMMQLAEEVGTSFVVVTHDMILAERMHRILHLEKGRLS